MKLNKAMLVAGIVTTVAAGSLAGTTFAGAQTSESGNGIIDKLVEKFNLNKDEVQAVFKEAHDERHAEMKAKQAERLAALVEDGTITQDQADALTAKHEELDAKREELKSQDLTREEIREQMQELKDEFKSWVDEQGFDLDAIRPEKGDGFRKHGHGGLRFNNEMEESAQ